MLYIPCISPVYPLYIPCISPVYPLYIPCISPVYPLYIPCISLVYPLYIPYISPVYPRYIPCIFPLSPLYIPRISLVRGDTGRWWSALRGRRGGLISSKGSRPFLGTLCALSGTLAVLRHHDNVLWLKENNRYMRQCYAW